MTWNKPKLKEFTCIENRDIHGQLNTLPLNIRTNIDSNVTLCL